MALVIVVIGAFFFPFLPLNYYIPNAYLLNSLNVQKKSTLSYGML